MMKPAASKLPDPTDDHGAVSPAAARTFDELLGKVREIKCQESREQTDRYCEIVVGQAHLKDLTNLLQAYFGAPLKPAGQKPSEEASAYAAPYGGIFDGQTLYFSQKGAGRELALLWPWGSGLATTVKLIRG